MAGSSAIVCEPAFVCGDWQQLPALRMACTICRSKPLRSCGVPSAVAGCVQISKALGIYAMPLSPLLEQTRKRRRDFFPWVLSRSRPLPRPDFEFPRPRRMTWARREWSLFPSLDNPPCGARQRAACDGVNVGQFGAGCPAARWTVAAYIAIAAPVAGADGAGWIHGGHAWPVCRGAVHVGVPWECSAPAAFGARAVGGTQAASASAGSSAITSSDASCSGFPARKTAGIQSVP